MKTKEQKKPTVLIVDDEYGKRIKVKVVDTLTVTTGKKLMIVSTMNKERKTLLVETPKKWQSHLCLESFGESVGGGADDFFVVVP